MTRKLDFGVSVEPMLGGMSLEPVAMMMNKCQFSFVVVNFRTFF